jgi:environmental stress-induced protein Ves
MSRLHRILCDQVAPTPWRNGAGLTRDLLHWPGAADWCMRVSVADIDVDSPFSAFADVERWFAVVEGRGVRLHLPDGMRRVAANGPALHFLGEDAPACELIDGPTRDLNLMCRRGRGQADMRRAEVGLAFDGPARLRALFCADALTLTNDAGDTTLAPFTLVWAEGATGAWRIGSTLPQPRAWWMTFDPAHRP